MLADFATPVAWIDDREALLRNEWIVLVDSSGRAIQIRDRFTLSAVDVDTGRQREIYPGPGAQ